MKMKKLNRPTIVLMVLILVIGTLSLPIGGVEREDNISKLNQEDGELFEINQWKINPQEASPGEEVEIDVEIINIGEVESNFTVEVYSEFEEDENRELIDWESDELEERDTRRVSFFDSWDDEGIYEITVEVYQSGEEDPDDTDMKSLEVIGGEFEITDRLSIDPKEAEPGETVNIEMEVENVGEATDDFTVEFLVEGELEEWDTVSLGAEETTTESFSVSRDEVGEYEFEINIIDQDNISDSFEVIEVSPLDVRMSPDYEHREWIYDGESFRTEIEVFNKWTESLDRVTMHVETSETTKEYAIGTIGADDSKIQEVRLTPDQYEIGENEIEISVEEPHEYDSDPKTISFRVLKDTSPVEVFLIESNSPIYEMETLEVSLVVAAAQHSGVEDLVIESLTDDLLPEGYWVGEEMKEVGEMEEIDDMDDDDLLPMIGDGDLMLEDENNEDDDRVIIGRKLMFEMRNVEDDSEPLEFSLEYELGNRSIEEEFEVDYEIKEGSSVTLIESAPAIGEEDEMVTVSLEISNQKDIDVEGVQIRPVEGGDVDPDEVSIHPSPTYWIGPMDSDEFLPVEFRVDSEDLEDGDTIKFEPEYRVGDGTLSGTPVEVEMNLVESEEGSAGMIYFMIFVIVAVVGVGYYWHKKKR